MGGKYQIRIKLKRIKNDEDWWKNYNDIFTNSFFKYISLRVRHRKSIIFWTVRP